jgi:hypothetical protein
MDSGLAALRRPGMKVEGALPPHKKPAPVTIPGTIITLAAAKPAYHPR